MTRRPGARARAVLTGLAVGLAVTLEVAPDESLEEQLRALGYIE